MSTVTATLHHRSYGVHTAIKSTTLDGSAARYFRRLPKTRPNQVADDYRVNEERLLAALPAGFLPVDAGRVLLVIRDSGQCGLKRFRNWAKYFSCYSLMLDTKALKGGE